MNGTAADMVGVFPEGSVVVIHNSLDMIAQLGIIVVAHVLVIVIVVVDIDVVVVIVDVAFVVVLDILMAGSVNAIQNSLDMIV